MRYLFLIFILIAAPLRAEPPRVVTTIAPLYGIVSDLMRGVGEPTLIVTEGMDPHYFALKPSQMFTLNDADILFAMGAGMEPWLERVLPGIVGDTVFLSEGPTLTTLGLSVRQLSQIRSESAVSTADSYDPHVWLSPFRASVMVLAIAEILAEFDPSNGSKYLENALFLLSASMDTGEEKLLETVFALNNLPIITTHDSLQYLDENYSLNVIGALSSITGEQAGARTISQLANIEGPVCLLIDTTEDSVDVETLFPDWTHVRYDPMGYEFAGEPNYLGNLYLSLAEALEACIPEG